MKTTTQSTWRTVEPTDALKHVRCRLKAARNDAFPASYLLCGFCRYPTDETNYYYVVREDGSTGFFKEECLEVEDDRQLSR